MNIYDCALLCQLSYTINESMSYEPMTGEETSLFEKVSSDISYIENKNSDQCCFVTAYNKSKVVVFRGTDSFEDTWYNIDIQHSELPGDIKFHRGFHNAFLSLKSELFETFDTAQLIIICGHSLGGVMARICGYYIKTEYPENTVKIITFGSPKFCNQIGVDWFIANIAYDYNVLNCNDPIIYYPRLGGYRGINSDIILLSGKDIRLTTQYPDRCIILCLLFNRLRNHAMVKYKLLCSKHLIFID